MSVGKDVSSLFCVQTGNIGIEKLVYLYLINYAKSPPMLTISTKNTFVKDASDRKTFSRVLAMMNTEWIRVACITIYLCEPLSRAFVGDPELMGGVWIGIHPR